MDGALYEASLDTGNKPGDNWTRLLDEGVVVDGDGYAYAVIRKGTLKKAFDAIPSNFQGYIDKDHVRAIFLGNYSKKDLRLVETGDGRYAIDVNVKLDRSLFAVQDLLKEGRHHALSVEMFTNVDEYATAEKVTGDPQQGKWLVPLIDELKIEGFAVCENPKNANSVNDGLLINATVEEGNNMTEEELKKLEAEKAAADADANKAEGEGEQAEDDQKADAPAEPSENMEGGSEEGDAEGDSEGETDDEKTDGENGDKIEELGAAIAQLVEDGKAKDEALAAKDKEIAELKAQLTAQAEKKNMSEEDRIAQLLKLATSATPSAAECAVNKESTVDAEKTEADEIINSYAAAFAATK